jgi:hypothetical protein
VGKAADASPVQRAIDNLFAKYLVIKVGLADDVSTLDYSFPAKATPMRSGVYASD